MPDGSTNSCKMPKRCASASISTTPATAASLSLSARETRGGQARLPLDSVIAGLCAKLATGGRTIAFCGPQMPGGSFTLVQRSFSCRASALAAAFRTIAIRPGAAIHWMDRPSLLTVGRARRSAALAPPPPPRLDAPQAASIVRPEIAQATISARSMGRGCCGRPSNSDGCAMTNDAKAQAAQVCFGFSLHAIVEDSRARICAQRTHQRKAARSRCQGGLGKTRARRRESIARKCLLTAERLPIVVPSAQKATSGAARFASFSALKSTTRCTGFADSRARVAGIGEGDDRTKLRGSSSNSTSNCEPTSPTAPAIQAVFNATHDSRIPVQVAGRTAPAG